MPRELQLEIDPSIDEVIDEVPGSSFIALRKLRWSPTSSFKLDIRRWYTNNTGEEIAGKGISFMTEQGPDNLIQALLKHGYGDTRKTLDGIKERPDFLENVKDVLDEMHSDLGGLIVERTPSTDIEELFYDPKSILG
jgi:hypothetical protein